MGHGLQKLPLKISRWFNVVPNLNIPILWILHNFTHLLSSILFSLNQILQHLYSESLKTHLGKILEPKIPRFYREIPMDLKQIRPFFGQGGLRLCHELLWCSWTLRICHEEEHITVDGSRNPGVQQLRLIVDPIIYRVLYVPGGAGFLPSTYVHCFSAPLRMISFTSMGIWFHPCSTAHPCKSISKFGYLTSLEFNISPERWWLEDDPFLLGRQAYFEGQTVKLQECNVVLPSIQAANIANQCFSRSYSHVIIIAAFPGTSFSTSTAGAKWSSFLAKTRWNKNTTTQLLTILTQMRELQNWKLTFILFEDHLNYL